MEVNLDELKERQENEVEALKSIFDSSFRDIRKENVWNVSDEDARKVPPELIIHLVPENSTQGYTEAHVSVDLRVKFCPKYPLVKPALSLETPTGLSTAHRTELLQKQRDTLRVFTTAGRCNSCDSMEAKFLQQ